MDDDFNTREAISALFDCARVVNKYEPSDLTEKSQRAVIDIFDDLGGKVLGLFSYKVQSLSDDEKKQGVVAASAGNQSQGVASVSYTHLTLPTKCRM